MIVSCCLADFSIVVATPATPSSSAVSHMRFIDLFDLNLAPTSIANDKVTLRPGMPPCKRRANRLLALPGARQLSRIDQQHEKPKLKPAAAAAGCRKVRA